MRPIIALILALTAAASAAPPTGLDSRQACVYECGCNSPDNNPPPDTGSCCSSAGGSLGGDVCPLFSLFWPLVSQGQASAVDPAEGHPALCINQPLRAIRLYRLSLITGCVLILEWM
jgi:hypothetical protein